MKDKTFIASGEKGRAKPLGAAIAGKLESGFDHVRVEGVGAGAVSNIAKAVAIANLLLAQDGAGFCFCVPSFGKKRNNYGKEYTIMKFDVYRSRKHEKKE